jgi:hypothetical protein
MSLLSRSRLALFLLGSSIVLSGCSLPFRKQAVSGLQVTTEGFQASVLLNGKEVSKTPYSDQNLKPGTYTLKMEPDGADLSPYETTLTLYPGTLAVVNWQFGESVETSGGVIYEMEPLKKKKDAQLSLTSIPDGAIVKVDDTSQGFTPVLLKSLTAGSHRFHVTLPSYKEEQQVVNIVEGFQMNVIVKLAKQRASTLPNGDDLESASDSAEASGSARTASSSATSRKTSTTPTKTPTPSSRNATSSASRSSSSEGSVKIKETGTGWLRVRSEPKTSGTELAKVDVGKSYPFSSTQDGWYEIEYESGKTGWVIGTYVTVE